MPEEEAAPEVIMPEEPAAEDIMPEEPAAEDIMPEEPAPEVIMLPDEGAMADEEAIGEDIIGEDDVIIGEDDVIMGEEAIIEEDVIIDDELEDEPLLDPVEDPHATRVRASAPAAVRPRIFLVNIKETPSEKGGHQENACDRKTMSDLRNAAPHSDGQQ